VAVYNVEKPVDTEDLEGLGHHSEPTSLPRVIYERKKKGTDRRDSVFLKCVCSVIRLTLDVDDVEEPVGTNDFEGLCHHSKPT
jgi:hypothetical protein